MIELVAMAVGTIVQDGGNMRFLVGRENKTK
jgi:hypothetical protein